MKGKEAIAYLKCSRANLCRLRKSGSIRAIRLDNGSYDYCEEDILNRMKKPVPAIEPERFRRFVTALGYDLESLCGNDRSRALADERRVVASVLFRSGYPVHDIAALLHRKSCSISSMLRTAYLVGKHIPAAEEVWRKL